MARLIGILGGGESGIGAALLAKKKGYSPFVSDMGQLKPSHKVELQAAGIAFEEGTHTMARLLESDLLIKSPGIPDNAPAVKALRESGKQVISEIEFAAWFCNGKTIAITGSNGKTTTTHLTHHLLTAGGVDAVMCGNVGKSFARLVCENPHAWYVLELSSFQLDGIVQYRPEVAILINISPDHLDRYDYKMDNYVASKFRVALNLSEGGTFFFNSKDVATQEYMQKHPLKVAGTGISFDEVENGILTLNENSFDIKESILRGPHNMLNANFAIRAALFAGAAPEGIREGLKSFINVPHRLEMVGQFEGVRYINDSKATNVDAVFWALEAMPSSTILILGGVDKGNDYTALLPGVASKVKAIVAMGKDNSKILNFFESKIAKCISTDSLEEALATAQHLAVSGDTVLLSPACASFDLFRNYEDRGDQFRTAVLSLVISKQ